MNVKCTHCQSPSTLYLCQRCMNELHRMLKDFPWWISRLQETAVGQARLGEPGRRSHRSGLETYANPKPAIDGTAGTEGQRRLEQDLRDNKLRARLLAQGGVNARASELLDEVHAMLQGWCRDVCERRGLYWIADPSFIGPLRANEMRFAPNTAAAMAVWLRGVVPALASAECADETFTDVRKAFEQMERAVNRPPAPKTCGPCPTPGVHGEDGFTIVGDARTRCGTGLEAREGVREVRCPTCKQTHEVEMVVERSMLEMEYMSFTIKELVSVVLPRRSEHIPRRTLYDWARKGLMKPTGYADDGKPKYVLADVRSLRDSWFKARLTA